jgi:hypothetical protein
MTVPDIGAVMTEAVRIMADTGNPATPDRVRWQSISP